MEKTEKKRNGKLETLCFLGLVIATGRVRFITSAQSRTHIHAVEGRQLRVHDLPLSRGRKETAKPPDDTVLKPLPRTMEKLVIVSLEITQNTCV